ncbi:MAG: hypothetical protein ACPG32_15670 [Akkermansiaceae bacterium]
MSDLPPDTGSDNGANSNSNGGNSKAALSAVALIAILATLIYIFPKVTAHLNGSSEQAEPAKDESAAVDESLAEADVPESLKQWFPKFEAALAKADKNYKILHMRLSKNGEQLLLDIQKNPEVDKDAERFDLILERDNFGRFVSSNNKFPMCVYPPEVERKQGE